MLHPPAPRTPQTPLPSANRWNQEAEALRQLMGDSASAPQESGPGAVSTMGALQYDSQIVQIALTVLDRRSDNVRKSMDPQDLVALQASLAQQGMMHPVIVPPLPNKPRGFRYRLVAGYRRTTAAQALGWTHVLARVLTTPLTDAERPSCK